MLAKAVTYCPHAEVLWLMAAKEKWLSGDVAGAKDILSKAFDENPESESIWLAAAKLAAETGQMEAAMQVLDKARKEADTDRVRISCHARDVIRTTDVFSLQIWMKSAALQRQI